MSDRRFHRGLARFVAAATDAGVEPLCHDLQACHFVAEFLLCRLREQEGAGRIRQRKQDLAIELLLRNPAIDDESVRRQLNTTPRQMQRWANYRLLRGAIRRHSTARPPLAFP